MVLMWKQSNPPMTISIVQPNTPLTLSWRFPDQSMTTATPLTVATDDYNVEVNSDGGSV